MEPLASKIRPIDIKDVVGQDDVIGTGMPLRLAIENGHRFSFILWGPPGCGKTTIARIYAKSIGGELHELSAVSAGKDDIRRIVEQGTLIPKVLFLDEIHRFNKAQQDFLLPYVENGTLTLIGATTENPSFEVIQALLSRCRVFVLHELNEANLGNILEKTGVGIPDDARSWLTRTANGDARAMLTLLEAALSLYGKVSVDTLISTQQTEFLRYDKHGDEHYNIISAFIKSMRASQPNAALYYLARMIEAGEDPKFIARRMIIFASEDIGMAQPTSLVVANEVFRAVETVGLPEAQINLAHGVVYLSLAPKDRSAYDAYFTALEDVHAYGNLPIPLEIRNAPTKLMHDIGYGKGYEPYTTKNLLPKKLHGKKYFSSPI